MVKMWSSAAAVGCCVLYLVVVTTTALDLPLCCEKTQAYDMQKSKCRYAKGDLPPIPTEHGLRNLSFFTARLEPTQCEHMFLIDPEEYEEDNFNVTDKGILRLGHHNPYDIVPGSFCIRYSFRENAKGTVSDVDVKITALACFPEEEESTSSKVIPVLLGVSIAFLSFLVILYVAIPRLRDLQGQCFVAFLSSTCMAFLLVIINHKGTTSFSTRTCRAVGYSLYYCFISIFFWLNILAYNVWRRLCWYSQQGWTAEVEKGNYRPLLYRLCVGYGCPFILLIILTVTDDVIDVPNPFKPGFGNVRCWFEDDQATLLWFYGPMALLLVVTSVILILISIRLYQSRTTIPENDCDWFNPYLKLFVISIIFWTLEMITYFYKPSPNPDFWLVVDVVLSMQGVVIFVIFGFRREVFRSLGWFSRSASNYNKEELSNSTV